MPDQDEILPFLDEGETLPSAPVSVCDQAWRILIVDDDRDVHEATEFALGGVSIQGRPLQFLHAYAGKEALDLLRQDSDVAVILLDVVMETEDAGLRIVQSIREELKLVNTRIILRTGQPGQAPEIETISRYDINDYKTKNELIRNKLYTTLTTAIRSYDQLRQLDATRNGLERIIAASHQFIAEQGLQDFADGVITQIAGFAGIKPEGVVCASTEQISIEDETLNESQPIIIGATGHYSHLIQRQLPAINDPRIVGNLSRCLKEQRSLIDEHSLTLFFPGRQGRGSAAFLDSPTPLREVDRNLLEMFCTNIALCGDNVTLVSRLRNYAFVDYLVNLPNRTALLQTLDQRLQSGERDGYSLALIDVDQFAEINDMFGHHYGDRLLRAMARRLEQEPLSSCTLARVAQDKFGIFGEDRLVRPEVLQPRFAVPFNIEGEEHLLSVSIGFVRASQQTKHGAELLQDASIALKHAKTSGLGQVTYYSDEVRTETRERTRLLHDLRRAFNHQHLFVIYQPQISLRDHSVIGVEALMRWRSDDGQFVSPDRFIPVAERSGLIIGLGNWVLRTALHALARLRATGYERLCMAVNVSVVQFRQPDFLHMVMDALHETGTRPEDLELEITESVAVLGFDYVESVLRQFKASGIRVAIDDFGTGFSSLSYLDRLSADRLKIDRSFVWALDCQQPGARIAEIVISLGRKLGMSVLAEGVETAAQATLLREMGCDDAQGYHYGKPMPLDNLLEWLSAWSHKP